MWGPKTLSAWVAALIESEHDPGRCRLSFRPHAGSTASSRASGSKLKSWSCGINSIFCNSARHAGCICWASRALFIWLCRCCPRILDAITIVRPETVVRWHRMGFAAYWRWKSPLPWGRPRIGKEVRDLIRRMSFGRFDREVVLYGFDLLELNGDDLRSLPLEQRNARLAELLAPVSRVERACRGGWRNRLSARLQAGLRGASSRSDVMRPTDRAWCGPG